MNHRTMILAVLAILAGCDQPPPPAAEAPKSTAAPQPSRAVSLADRSDALEWTYGWPAEAAAIPALDRALRSAAAESKAEAQTAAREDRARARQSGEAFSPHSFTQNWVVAGAAPGLLSLVGAFDQFTGGAHGTSGWEALLWDRNRGREITLDDVLADPLAAKRLLATAFCPALDAERAQRRGSPVVTAADDPFTQCPAIDDQVLVPAGPADGPFTRIRVLVAPYEAGPYAEGGYEIELPVTAELIALVKPAYRAAFAA